MTAEQLAPYYKRCDPLMDAAVAALMRLHKGRSKPVRKEGLASGLFELRDEPPEVQDVRVELEKVPPWVDWDQLKLGGATYRRCGVMGGWILACCALPRSYSLAAGNKPLVSTRELVDLQVLENRSHKRLAGTAQFVHANCQPHHGPHSDPWKSTVDIRFYHSRIRRILWDRNEWDPRVWNLAWGEPINQVYLAHTNLAFSVSHLDHLRRLGFHFSRAEADAVMHLWRYSGYLLGIEPELLCATEDEGRRLMKLIESMHLEPDDDSHSLTKALMTKALPGLILAICPAATRIRPRWMRPRWLRRCWLTAVRKRPGLRIPRLIRSWLIRCCYGISHSLLGHRVARGLGYRSTSYRHFARLMAQAVVTPLEVLRGLVPGLLHARMVNLGTWSIEKCLKANPLPPRPHSHMRKQFVAAPGGPAAPDRPSPTPRWSEPAMRETTFSSLEQKDQDLFLENAPLATYHRNDPIMTEGVIAGKLFLIRQGSVRVEHLAKGKGVAVARLGPDQVLGEMGFLEAVAPNASVIADEEVQARVVDAAGLRERLGNNAGFACRLYQWLAIIMAQRLRKTTHDWATTVAQQQAALRRFHLDRTLQLSQRQLPQDLVKGVAAFRQELQDVQRDLEKRQPAEQAAQEKISAACDDLRDLVEEFTQPAALEAIGRNDLKNLSTAEQLAEGVGMYVLREVFPLLMTSATMARCYTKPRGYPDDPETRERMYDNQEEGDGPLGGYLDRWFLSGPVCKARRQGRKQIAAQLAKAAASVGNAGLLRITSLACGGAEELFDFLRQSNAPVYATGIDIDTDSLEATAEEVSKKKYEKQVTLVRADVIGLLSGGGAVSVREQHVIYAQGFGDYLSDEQFKLLLTWACENLQDGGVVALAGLDLGHADQAFLQHILEWEVHPRSEARLRELVQQSRLRDRPEEGLPLEVLEVVAGGGGAFLVARRRPTQSQTQK